MLTGKQRRHLKRIAQELDPVIYIGKADLTPAILRQIDDHLTANEIVKCQIQDGSLLDPKETCNDIARQLGAEFVQAIGHRFVLYRQAKDPALRRIVIPR